MSSVLKYIQTGVEYCLNAIRNLDCSIIFMSISKPIQITSKSEEPDIHSNSILTIASDSALTPEQQTFKELWQQYEQSEMLPFETVKNTIPNSVIQDVISLVKTGKFNALQLRINLLPICIEYGVEQTSLCQHIQKTLSEMFITSQTN